ncbi:unnamed protein product [Polarella glacialis]|uniref:Uncharacterized protein n=1 Tax=Polarella glacialis TaxID=89957 RepID=A0A813FL93_POLGL|nr:unnamed protein product [Polarella glacialis]
MLRTALTSKPDYFTNHFRQVMRNSLNLATGVTTRSRDYVTMRTELSDHRPTINWAWLLGGVWDVLERGQPAEAQARVSLAMTVGEKVSVDHGSWMLWRGLSCEDLPPYALIAGHVRPPTPGVLTANRTADALWLEVLLSHLKEINTYSEARKRLTRGPSPAPLLPVHLDADGVPLLPKAKKNHLCYLDFL